MSKSNPRSLNNWTVLVFGPVLVVTGILGYVTPDHLALMSGASPYNLFHIFFGCLALGIALSGHEQAARAFNVLFGLGDLYQAVANQLGWFPQAHFGWTVYDDVVHVVIGLALVGIGCWRRPAG